MLIRDEKPEDVAAISRLITAAMLLLPQATGSEARIVERLRADGALMLSLVADENGEVLGHLAASAAQIGAQAGWGLIGPVAVLPARHRQGIGSALMNEALRRLRATCRGAALVGNPAYYGRFGFRAFPGFSVAGIPPEVVLALPFDGSVPRGELMHHAAFGLDQPSHHL
jgi:putative acetyltransferase